MSVKSVAVWGGTGNLGPAVINALVDAGFEVTVLSRSAKTPPGHISDKAKFVQVHSEEHDAFATALQGIDAVVSVVGWAGILQQTVVIDKAIAAGVKVFIPSEFGGNAGQKGLPVFDGKLKTQRYLQQKADEGNISYTVIANGPFLDWGIQGDWLVNTSAHGQSTIYNGGDVNFSTTTLSDVGRAVAGVLHNPQQFKNRHLQVNSTITTQNKIFNAAQKASSTELKRQDKLTKDVLKRAHELVKAGQGDNLEAQFGFIAVSIFDPSYGGEYKDQQDSKAVGLKFLDDAAVEKLVVDIVNKKQARV